MSSDIIRIDFEGREAVLHLDENGRYSLNDLHEAAGGAAKHKPALFFRLESTQALISAIEQRRGTDLYLGQKTSDFQAVEAVRGGAGGQGTFVVKHLVYAYAMWVSPDFMLKVIDILDEIARTGAYHADRWYAAIDVYNAGKKVLGKRHGTEISMSFHQALISASRQPGMAEAIKGDNGEWFIRESMTAAIFFACSTVKDQGMLVSLGKGDEVLRQVREKSWITGKKADELVEASVGRVWRQPDTLCLA